MDHGGGISTSASAVDGSIFIASSSSPDTSKKSGIAKFNSEGSKEWEITNPYPYLADVATDGNVVYVSGSTKSGFNNARAPFISAYSLDNGDLLWSKEYPNSGASSINDIVVDGSLYVAANLYGKRDFDTATAGKLDLDGNEIWWSTPSPRDWNNIKAVRVIEDQVIGVGYKADGGDRQDLRLIAFDINTGALLWEKSWGDNNGQATGNMEVSNGKIYTLWMEKHGIKGQNAQFSAVDEPIWKEICNTYRFDVSNVRIVQVT